CSICGIIASEQAADHDSSNIMGLPKFDVTMGSQSTTPFSKDYLEYNDISDEKTFNTNRNFFENDKINVDDINKHTINTRKFKTKKIKSLKKDGEENAKSRVIREIKDPGCDSFKLESGLITHPHNILSPNKHYYNNSNCVTVIDAGVGNVVKMTFIDMFRIENHPECIYDYLEIRDGFYGFAKLLGKVCGQAFPKQITTSGPYAWLKFHSDDTIEYEGFKISIEFKAEAHSHKIPAACHKTFTNDMKGVIEKGKNFSGIDPECVSGSEDQPLDVLWTIITEEENKIYLNFTTYDLYKPNECEDNVIQVFGSVIELDSKLAQYCGSVANSVTTKDPDGNIMHVRFYASQLSKVKSLIKASFNPFRMVNQAIEGAKCRDETEFDCEDNTCIPKLLACDDEAQCRLKADEEPSRCKTVHKSAIEETHILVILIIFSLILSSMSFVFIFKCVRKLYQDHKIIKEHLRQSTEDRLDAIDGSRLTLDPHKLQMDSEPRASLERENLTNEMYKKKRSFSKHKQPSIESDYIIETQIDFEEETWRREVDSMPTEVEDIRIERNGRTRRSDLSKKEESIRHKTKESDENRERKEIRDVSVGAPDTKESGCQTRESLFQTDPPPSSDGSGTNSRGFSTFGYSGATIARPSPPASTKTSEITIELLKQVPPQESKPQKKLDRRPISTETTRSAPDVIIVSKPIR
ncbi:unnamed protein product, partial [Arctia plantaginis]